MTYDITHTVAGLSAAGSADVSALSEEIDRQVRAGRLDRAGALGEQLAAHAATGKDVQWQHEVLLQRLLQTVSAHPGPQSVRTLLRIPASLRSSGAERTAAERRLATLIAHGQRIEDVEQVVFAPGADSVHSLEFAACLLQEMVLTGAPVEQYAALRSFAGTLVAARHPLAGLPLSLLPAERGLRRPPHADASWTWTVPPTPSVTYDGPELHASPSSRSRTADLDLTEITGETAAVAMGAAVQHWRDSSNGLVATQEFWSPDPVAPEDLPAVIERLPLIPWPEGQPTDRLYASTSDEVLRVLLSAAVRSPAYGGGMYGAYGRLAAWRSLGALAGAPADAPIGRTAELVEQTHWFRLGTSSPWFQEVAWDLAVAAVRPGGQEIAVLAATDTD
ncbi:DUF6183 family protein [Streptomyces peucetius]|uniref:DUF6183 family protein n=1 Tax=Streptomyces peucetius TaxID=1950 RepID=A0ABY6I537_STRPE|nr:DUF6183 family protein [Streptomyces peucetius]UYQ60865.1 DUF6183 family protein [Streptomyces peucetius]